MAIRWGPELVLIYNDAYRPILLRQAPQGIGVARYVRSGGRSTPSSGHSMKPSFAANAKLFSRKTSPGPYNDRERSSRRTIYISYSPIPDEAAPNGIAGVLTTCIETTERVRKEAAPSRSE